MAGSLKREVKLFIVRALACFDAPSEVAKAVKAEFDITVSRQQVELYDPNKRAGQALSEDLAKAFRDTRATFLADTAEIAVSHRNVRLRTLQRLAAKAESMGNLPLVAELLEQAAKEVGNAFTNKRELSGPEGKAIPVDGSIRVEFVSPSHADGPNSGDLPQPVDPGAV